MRRRCVRRILGNRAAGGCGGADGRISALGIGRGLHGLRIGGGSACGGDDGEAFAGGFGDDDFPCVAVADVGVVAVFWGDAGVESVDGGASPR